MEHLLSEEDNTMLSGDDLMLILNDANRTEETLIRVLDGKKVSVFYTERLNPQQLVLENINIE